jgi:hypothetical protein
MKFAKLIFLMITVVLVSSSCTKITSRDEAPVLKPPEKVSQQRPEYNSGYQQYGNFSEYIQNEPPVDKIRLSNSPPGPFGPQTSIVYSLPESCDVSIKISDVVGTGLDSVFWSLKPPGTYRILWNPADNPSGFYLVKLSACDTTLTTKITILY